MTRHELRLLALTALSVLVSCNATCSSDDGWPCVVDVVIRIGNASTGEVICDATVVVESSGQALETLEPYIYTQDDASLCQYVTILRDQGVSRGVTHIRVSREGFETQLIRTPEPRLCTEEEEAYSPTVEVRLQPI